MNDLMQRLRDAQRLARDEADANKLNLGTYAWMRAGTAAEIDCALGDAIDAITTASLRASLPNVIERLAELEQQAEPVKGDTK